MTGATDRTGRDTSRDGQREQETAELVERLRGAASPEEERRLRQQLVVVNMPVAVSIARRYRARGENFEDLVQAAQLALVKAVNAYDVGRGNDLLAYAVPTITGELKRHFRDRGWDIRPPRRLQELRPDVERAAAELAQELGRSPRTAEIAAHLGVPEEDVVESVASGDLYRVHSLDAPAVTDESVHVGDLLGGEDPRLDVVDDLLSLRPALARLTARERRVLALRFGHDLTQQQIAERIGVTQMQVSRILTRVLRRLREELAAA